MIRQNAVVRLGPARFAWVVPLVGVVSLGVTVALLIGGASEQLVDAEGDALPIGVISLVFGCVGSLIISRQPANAVGWIFCGIGLAGAAAGSSAVYAELSLPGRVWGACLNLGGRTHGEEIHHRRPEQIARRGVGLVPQGRRVFLSLTVEAHLGV